jgi:protein O-GlcNAc transferase
MHGNALESLAHSIELFSKGRSAEAEIAVRQHLACRPDDAAALQFLGMLCFKSGRLVESGDLLRRAIRVRADDAALHSNYAMVLGAADRYEEAAAELQLAVRLKPDLPVAHNNLGVTLEWLGKHGEAAKAYERAAELAGNEPLFFSNLGNALRAMRRLSDAEPAYRKAIACRADFAPGWHGLATILLDQPRVQEAITASHQACQLLPRDPAALSDLLFALNYDPAMSPDMLFREHRTWSTRYELPKRKPDVFEGRNVDRERRIRIGYVSADFREHTRSRFTEGVLAHHDHRQFEIICFSDVIRPDTLTQRLRDYADRWHNTAVLSHDQLAELIRREEVDLLVELTGHMAANRLPVFALKPAPVQVAYPGYPATTGLVSIDYLLTDLLRDPAGCERYYSEKLWHLAPTSQVYRPSESDQTVPRIHRTPYCSCGYITFGSLNKPVKLNHQVLDTWAKLMLAIPDCRLILLAPEVDSEGRPRSLLPELLALRSVNPDRIELVGTTPRARYLEQYNRIDIALDPWPYNGHTTTLDALWMGVPVVGLQGSVHASRETSCVLTLLGLADWIAQSTEQYVDTAVRKAADPAALNELRVTLRERMLASPLCDARGLTRRIEAAYRQMWIDWCSKQELSS